MERKWSFSCSCNSVMPIALAKRDRREMAMLSPSSISAATSESSLNVVGKKDVRPKMP